MQTQMQTGDCLNVVTSDCALPELTKEPVITCKPSYQPGSYPPNRHQKWVRPKFIFHFNPAISYIVLQGGPIVTKLCNGVRPRQLKSSNQIIGFGLRLSLCVRRAWNNRITLEFMMTYSPSPYRGRFATIWGLDCVRIVSQRASIFQYVRRGSMKRVIKAFERGQASLRDTTEEGITLLHTACGSGHFDLVQFLIGQGADVNAGDEVGDTPLHRATSMKDGLTISKLLIENGADVFNVNIEKRTPLHSMFNHTIGKILTSEDLLESVGPDSVLGMSISHFLAWSSRTTPQEFKSGRVCDATDLWATDNLGRSCSHYAAFRGNLGLLQWLLDQASPVELFKKDSSGESIIHCAARSSRMVAVIELLRSKGLEMSAVDNEQQDVLHHAAKWRELEAIKNLMNLEMSEALLLPDGKGRMPSDIAYSSNRAAVFLYLKDLESTQARVRSTHSFKASLVSENSSITEEFRCSWQNCLQKQKPARLILQLAFKDIIIAVGILFLISRACRYSNDVISKYSRDSSYE